MSTPQNAATDVFQSWTTTIQAVGDAAGRQASGFRRLVRGMFDLADQAVVVERELATFLTVNAQTRTPVTDQVEKAARVAGVPVVEVGETLPTGTSDYVEWITDQLDVLSKALDRP